MNAETNVLLLCAIIILICASYLVVHEDYDDGFFGRAFLVVSWGVALIFVYGIVWVNERFEVNNMVMVLVVALTCTLARTATKFYLWHSWGISSWKRASTRPKVKVKEERMAEDDQVQDC